MSITLNATFVKPNAPIHVIVEVTSDDPFISVKIDNFPLEKTDGKSWEGTINASSLPGEHVLSVIVCYNDIQCINDSTIYCVVEEGVLDIPVGTLLLFFTVYGKYMLVFCSTSFP
ncbi:MAG: hypothetical protein ACUVXA_14310, partial [Candidatus Jordarchaeum sp.]|uniref:hypothetical protein n=1 Tax=Candidatus Jordarchaeum sp. TaxID=2823881 RepID=UPI00404906A2